MEGNEMTKEEAIEIIRDARCTSPLRDALETLIPELRESEDERIRKDLITYLKSVQGETLDLTISVPKWIAYLEKQKEQKPLSPDEKMNHSLYLEGFNVGREVGKVEAEQKPEDRFEEAREKYQVEWSEEDEHRRKDAIYFLESAKKHYADTSEIEKTIAWLKSLRPSWKPSEEQMKILEKAVAFFKTEWTGTKIKEVLNLESLYEQLKSIQ